MATTQQRQSQDKKPQSAPAVDPVCGMTVEGGDPSLTIMNDGEKLQFCSKACMDKFRADPERYAI